MTFDQPLVPGTLIRRYKRFLADVEMTDGTVVTAHTPNTGSMLGCCTPGSKVWLSESDKPGRKYRHGWELVEAAPEVLVGINTGLANHLVSEAVTGGVITELQGYAGLRREVPYGWLDIIYETRSCGIYRRRLAPGADPRLPQRR